MISFELAVSILAAFFVAGIVAGVLLVTMPRRPPGQGQWYQDGPDWKEPPAPREDDEESAWWHAP